MKHTNKSKMDKFRRRLAGFLALAIVVGVPIWTIYQLVPDHILHRRYATPLAAMQVRAIDKTTATPKTFQEPLISVTFDDGYETTYSDALPILQKRGIVSTQYVLSGVENDLQYLSWNQIKAIQKAGHEIGCHTISHPDLLTLKDDAAVMEQLTGCKQTVESHLGTKVTDFASPYGSYNTRTLNDIKKVFASQRNTNGDSSNGVTGDDVNTDLNFNPLDIIGMTVKRTTTQAEIQQLIDFTVKNNGWLVLTYHQADDGPSKYGLDPKKLDEQMAILQRAPVRIVTVNQAITSWKAGQ